MSHNVLNDPNDIRAGIVTLAEAWEALTNHHAFYELLMQAVDEIDTLRAEVERLQAELGAGGAVHIEIHTPED